MTKLNKEALETGLLAGRETANDVMLGIDLIEPEQVDQIITDAITAYLAALPMGEPVAWQYRFRVKGSNEWIGWREGEYPYWDDTGWEHETRTLYTADAFPPRHQEDALREELAWYGEQARLARLIHSEGDAGRAALAEDGGKRASALLSEQEPKK
jgi:hypothetical protein